METFFISRSKAIVRRSAHRSSRESAKLSNIRLTAFRIEYCGKEPEYGDDGVPGIMAGHDVKLRLWGEGLTENTLITLTKDPYSFGGSCLKPSTDFFPISIDKRENINSTSIATTGGGTTDSVSKLVTATVKFTAPIEKARYYFCLNHRESEKVSFWN